MLRIDLLWLWRQLSQCNVRTPGSPVIKNVALLGVVFYQRWLRVLDSESSVLLAWAETRSTEIITNRLWAWYGGTNSVTRQVSFNRSKIGGKCQNSKIQMRQCVETRYARGSLDLHAWQSSFFLLVLSVKSWWFSVLAIEITWFLVGICLLFPSVPFFILSTWSWPWNKMCELFLVLLLLF